MSQKSQLTLWHLSSWLRYLALTRVLLLSTHQTSPVLTPSDACLPPHPTPWKPSQPPEEPQQQGGRQRSSDVLHSSFNQPQLEDIL